MSSDDGSGAMDDLRKMLETSWNTDQMGKLPTTPIDAANEAGGSLLTAKERGLDVVLVNLLLPSYDITMGSNVYDEVEAVTFCAALSEFLDGKACLVVRDNKTVHAVNRVLEARAEREEEEARANLRRVEDTQSSLNVEEEEEEEEEDEQEGTDEEEGGNLAVEDKAVQGNAEDSSKAEDLEDFRQQLMMGWGDDDEDATAASEDTTAPVAEDTTAEEPEDEGFDMLNPEPKPKNYRLTSMFGDATFKPGPDRFEKVIQAVSANGQPKEDEENLVILSANSEEETIGIRALAAKYQNTKTIVLVNCQMDPIPRELLKAETIYSLLPLIAKPKDAQTDGAPSEVQPKVIVLRRYPRDFEVFMDFGNGFDLTETVTTTEVGRTGPSLPWIVERVRRQMDLRYLR